MIRRQFTRIVYINEEQTLPTAPNSAGNARVRSRRIRRVAVTPSERFVWGMVALIVALVGVILLEALYIMVTGTVNAELLAVISGLTGSLVTAFVMGKRND